MREKCEGDQWIIKKNSLPNGWLGRLGFVDTQYCYFSIYIFTDVVLFGTSYHSQVYYSTI